MCCGSAATRKHTIWWGKNILRRGKRTFGGEYTKYNEINNNSENFRGQNPLAKSFGA